ncbi:MAG: hypothetical protein MR691_04220 [Clostridium sp.]|nr:hypothetical protein [Clostridium sp.]
MVNGSRKNRLNTKIMQNKELVDLENNKMLRSENIEYNSDSLKNTLDKLNNDILRATILYSDLSGNNGNITLSDNVSNYSYIEIFYRDNDNNYNSMKYMYKSNNQNICLSTTPVSIGEANYVRIKSAEYTVNEKNINFTSYADWNVKTNSGWIETNISNNIIYIIKVIGWK